MASNRKRNNMILRIKDDNNTWIDKEKDIVNVFVSYFNFTTSCHTNIKQIFQTVDCRISNEVNADLVKEFTVEEIKGALDQIHSNKAPSPDGMIICFFKKFWPIVGGNVTRILLAFLNGGEQLTSINHTNLVLVPKKKSPCTPKDYKPISLYNVLYKIISKVLANMLKTVLPDIIDESQIAFLKGRMIFDNVMVAHETIQAMKN